MDVEEAIGAIENGQNSDELKDTLQKIIENYGFACFNLLDAGRPHVDVPYYIGTTPEAWVETYKNNGFVHLDPCVALVRRLNTPFVWNDVPIPEYEGTGRKPGAYKVMEAARDHGFTEGFVVPFHYRDRFGRMHSSSAAFYWTDQLSRFRFLLSRKRFDLHIIMIYWAQRIADLVAVQIRNQTRRVDAEEEKRLTDRERDVLAWAARGKTASETADILKIAESTVETHLKNAMTKLNAVNKTNAAVKAISLGLIDL